MLPYWAVLREQHEAGGTQHEAENMKFRASLTQHNDEIKGVVECGNDPAFNLEALTIVVERIAATHEVDVVALLEDVWRIHVKQNHHQ